MSDYIFLKDQKLLQLRDKLDALIELHSQKYRLYTNAIKNKNSEMAKRLYGESNVVWQSIEEIKKELSEYL